LKCVRGRRVKKCGLKRPFFPYNQLVEDELTPQVRRAAKTWRSFVCVLGSMLELGERLAQENPDMAVEAYDDLAYRLYFRAQTRLRNFFGLEVRCNKLRVMRPEFAPDDVDDLIRVFEAGSNEPIKHRVNEPVPPSSAFGKECREAILEVLMYKSICIRVMRAKKKDDPARAVRNAFLRGIIEWTVGHHGLVSTTPGLPPEMQQSSVARLAGWVAWQTSLKANRRLNAAMSSNTSGSPRHQLLQELPAATLVEWSRGDEIKGLFTLARRVRRDLEKLGRETDFRPEQVANVDFDSATIRRGDDDIELSRFEALEAARRQLSELKSRSRLSQKEMLILEADLRGQDVKDTARDLGIAEATVRVLRKRYRDKMRNAAGGEVLN
jgi:hypothetical protein